VSAATRACGWALLDRVPHTPFLGFQNPTCGRYQLNADHPPGRFYDQNEDSRARAVICPGPPNTYTTLKPHDDETRQRMPLCLQRRGTWRSCRP
jgi:hypothetical protein